MIVAFIIYYGWNLVSKKNVCRVGPSELHRKTLYWAEPSKSIMVTLSAAKAVLGDTSSNGVASLGLHPLYSYYILIFQAQ